MITILAGGTGSVKLVRGFASQRSDVNVITNVGDDYWLYGMYICPDIDTIIYGLCDLLDQDKGWGIKKDTFGFLRQMEILVKIHGSGLVIEILLRILPELTC